MQKLTAGKDEKANKTAIAREQTDQIEQLVANTVRYSNLSMARDVVLMTSM